jgi:hypothetical protein
MHDSVTVKSYGMFIDAMIQSVSATFLQRLSDVLEKEDFSHIHSLYSRPPVSLKVFRGFDCEQLRLRYPGRGLHVHLDRTSAYLTVLYYLNACDGGEVVLYVSPEEKCQRDLSSLTAERESLFADGGLSKVGKDLRPLVLSPDANMLVVFWSDCVPHEILDIRSPRLAFQVWFSENVPAKQTPQVDG